MILFLYLNFCTVYLDNERNLVNFKGQIFCYSQSACVIDPFQSTPTAHGTNACLSFSHASMLIQ